MKIWKRGGDFKHKRRDNCNSAVQLESLAIYHLKISENYLKSYFLGVSPTQICLLGGTFLNLTETLPVTTYSRYAHPVLPPSQFVPLEGFSYRVLYDSPFGGFLMKGNLWKWSQWRTNMKKIHLSYIVPVFAKIMWL